MPFYQSVSKDNTMQMCFNNIYFNRIKIQHAFCTHGSDETRVYTYEAHTTDL